METHKHTGERLLRFAQLHNEYLPISRTELTRRIASGEAPAPVKIGKRAVAWRESEIQAYVERLAGGKDRKAAA